jgi:hypothetical protein
MKTAQLAGIIYGQQSLRLADGGVARFWRDTPASPPEKRNISGIMFGIFFRAWMFDRNQAHCSRQRVLKAIRDPNR